MHTTLLMLRVVIKMQDHYCNNSDPDLFRYTNLCIRRTQRPPL